MNTEQLKKVILQQAIQGKLTEAWREGIMAQGVGDRENSSSSHNRHCSAGFASSPFSHSVTASPQSGAASTKDAPQKQSFGGAAERSEAEGAAMQSIAVEGADCVSNRYRSNPELYYADADTLLEQIKIEKQRLIAEGKIKKDKNESTIFKRGNSYFEKIGDSEKCIDDELPFEIPDTWRWARLGNIFNLQAGKNIIASNIHKEESDYYSYLCYGGNGIRGYVNTYNNDGHFAIIGRQGALCGCINFAKGKFYATEHAVVVNHFNRTNVIWGGLFLKALNLNQYATAVAQPGLAVNKIEKVLIPLPPLAEQQAIVEKVEECFDYLNNIEKAYSSLTTNALSLKSKILELAIQGKLVEQLPEEGTAEELYNQIQTEKAELIKQGKLKKEKPLAPISPDEIPFEIPKNWFWTRLGQILIIARGGSPRPIKDFLTDSEDGINWIKIGDSDIGGKYINSTKEKIIPEGMKKSRFVHKGDFLLSNSMSFGRPYILNIDGCIHDGWLVLHPVKEIFDKDFLYYLLSSSMVFNQFCNRVAGAVVNNLNSDKAALTLVPLPPLAEQHRIVAKIEELFTLVDKLSK